MIPTSKVTYYQKFKKPWNFKIILFIFAKLSDHITYNHEHVSKIWMNLTISHFFVSFSTVAGEHPPDAAAIRGGMITISGP